jgi:hypothetical protein
MKLPANLDPRSLCSPLSSSWIFFFRYGSDSSSQYQTRKHSTTRLPITFGHEVCVLLPRARWMVCMFFSPSFFWFVSVLPLLSITHTHTHTHIHTRTRTHTHWHPHTCTRTYITTFAHTRWHTCVYTRAIAMGSRSNRTTGYSSFCWRSGDSHGFTQQSNRQNEGTLSGGHLHPSAS